MLKYNELLNKQGTLGIRGKNITKKTPIGSKDHASNSIDDLEILPSFRT